MANDFIGPVQPNTSAGNSWFDRILSGGLGVFTALKQSDAASDVAADQRRIEEARLRAAGVNATAASAWTKYIPLGLAVVVGIALIAFVFRRTGK